MSRRSGRTILLAAAFVLSTGASFAQPRSAASAKLEAIDAALEAWDVPGAKKALDEATQLAPKDIEPLHYYRGRIAFESGDYATAVTELTAAGVEDKEDSYLRLAKQTLAVTRDDKRIEGEHFIFFYPPGKDEILAPYALETLEKQRAALEKALGYAPPDKIRIEVVNDAKELSKVSTLSEESIHTTGTIAICKFDKLMVTSPKAVLRGYDWLDTAAHEFTHLVVTRASRNTVPIWLHEGIAKYFESAWRGAPGLAMPPSSLALLGRRVKMDQLVPFEKMHPSIALLPTAEDAATAFGEVFFAVDLIYKNGGAAQLRQILSALRAGATDREAVAQATRTPFEKWEKTWLAHVRKQPFPKGSESELPLDHPVLDDVNGKNKKREQKGREISYGELAEVVEEQPRRIAHLGELLRERNHIAAAAEEYGKAYAVVGDKYESVSNKYALALLAIKRTDEAERVLLGSLKLHPDSTPTEVHLGRIYLARKDWPNARDTYTRALATDPFDPEIHVGMLRADMALGDPTLSARERKASAILIGISEKEVDAMIKRASNIEDAARPPMPEPSPGAPASSDAGR